MHCCAKPNLSEKRIVLIIGGGNGIGYCLTETLLKETGDTVISCDIDIKSSLQKLHRQHQQSSKHQNRFHICDMNVTDTASIQECIDEIKSLQTFQSIDRIILSCGVFNGGPLLEMSDTDFTNTFNVNIVGIWRVIKSLFGNHLLKYGSRNRNNNSRIIIISSELASSNVVPFGEPYPLTKVCLQNLCRTLKIELSTLNIDVITVNPGAVNTQLLNKMESKFAVPNHRIHSPFAVPCELAMKIKNSVMKYSVCSEAQYIVDNALMYAIHCDYKYTKSEYYIGRTWANYLQPFIPNQCFDFLLIHLFYLWGNCRRKKHKIVPKKEE